MPLSVADAAGGEWPGIARKAAVALVTSARDADPSLDVRLLGDLKIVFGEAYFPVSSALSVGSAGESCKHGSLL